jgi:predicted MFS family arabinose efflux permease
MPPRTVYLVCAALSVISSFGLALSDAFGPALLFRALTGLGLAGMYMPGLRSLTDGIEGSRRARVSALYTSSFTVGTTLSFLLGRAGILWGWRAAFMVAAVVGLAGFVLAWVMLPRSSGKSSPAKTFFPLRAVLQNRSAVILIIAYTATIWGAVGLRQWVVVFLGFSAGDPTRTDWSMLSVPRSSICLESRQACGVTSSRSGLAFVSPRSSSSSLRPSSRASLVSPPYCPSFL